MILERQIKIDEAEYCVIISDDPEALSAARAAGRVSVGLLTGTGFRDFSGTEYLIESLDSADDFYLERVVRRSLKLPWNIAESDRLCIREFTEEDSLLVPKDPDEGEGDSVFRSPDKLAAYIHSQYRFYEYGVWAVVRKCDGVIVGIAGVSDCDLMRNTAANFMQLELGYRIFVPYRRQGYAYEACLMILNYVNQEYACPVCAVTASDNRASRHLLEKLGFLELSPSCGYDSGSLTQKCSGSVPLLCRYVLY